MTEYSHDGVDRLVGIDRGVGPCGDNLLDCVVDDDTGDLACWFVQVAREVIYKSRVSGVGGRVSV